MFRINQQVGFWARAPQCVLTINTIKAGSSSSDAFTDEYLASPAYIVEKVANANSREIWIRHITAGPTQNLALLNLDTATITQEYPSSSFGLFNPTTAFYPTTVDPVDGSAYLIQSQGGNCYKCTRTGTITSFNTAGGGSLNYDWLDNSMIADIDGTHLWTINGPSGGVSKIIKNLPDFVGHTFTASVSANVTNGQRYIRNAMGIANRIYAFNDGIFYADTSSLAITQVITDGGATGKNRAIVGYDGNIYSVVGTALRKHDPDGNLLNSVTIANLDKLFLYDSTGHIWCGTASAGVLTYVKVDASQMAVVGSVSNIAGDGINYVDIIGEFTPGVPIVHTSIQASPTFGAVGLINCI